MKAKKSSLLFSSLSHKLLGAKMTYRLRYLHHHGHLPNMKNPQDMSEILISQMFTPKTCAQYAPFIDKLAVRDYLEWLGLGKYLLKHYGVWSRPEDVEFDKLPNKFALKSNNGCGHHVFCRDSNYLDRSAALDEMRLAIMSGINNIEPHYHFITPRIYAEELIETDDGSLPVDYKFTCIGGTIMDIFVATDRDTNTHYCTFDQNWELLPYTKSEFLPEKMPKKPKHLDKLIEIARIISQNFDFVRVDMYEYHDQPYISELTFFPWGGLLYSYTNETIKLYGRKWRDIETKQNNIF